MTTLYPIVKVCTMRKLEKPLDHYSQQKDGRYKARCKDCIRAVDRERNHKRRPRKTPIIPKATHEGYKVCNTCLVEKPYSDFMHDIAQKDGYAGRCKQCKSDLYHASPEKKEARKAYNDAYRDANREELQAYDRARSNTDEHRAKRREQNRPKIEARLLEKKSKMPPPHKVRPISLFKTCPQCATEKFLTEFALSKGRPDSHSPICKECTSKQAHERLDKRREYDHNRDIESKQFRRETIRQWRRAHPLALREYQMKRNARHKNAPRNDVDYMRILERDGMWCYICSSNILPHHTLEFDHQIPLLPRLGEPQGAHSEENIHPTHKECNARKSNRRFEDLIAFDKRGVDY